MTGEALCHCGAPVKVHDGGFTRGLCADCDEVRCDVDGSCGVVTDEALSPAQVIADVLNAAFDAIWFSADMVTSDLLSALDRAGYVIAPREALDEALEGMLDMRSYVPDYFADKWEHDKAIARFTALIEAGATPRKDAET